MNNRLVDFVDKLNASKSAAGLYEVSRDFFQSFGFRYLNVGIFKPATLESLGMFSNMSQDWMNHYIDADFASVDPYIRLGANLEGTLQVSHRSVFGDNEHMSTLQKSLLSEVEAEGFKSCLVQAKSSKGSDVKAAMNLILDQDLSQMQRLMSTKTPEILVGTALSSLSFMDYEKKDLSGTEYYPFGDIFRPLSRREIEVIQWLAAGLRNDRIADKLSISNATVNFHIVSAKRKLDAKTREQLVAISVLRGLVEL